MLPTQVRISQRLLKGRRITISGGTNISVPNAQFCKQLGKELVSEQNLVIVTGGFKCFNEKSLELSTDWSSVSGALAYLHLHQTDPAKRIETLLPQKDWSAIERFKVGNTVVLHNRNSQSRRFALVNFSDAVVTVQGADGTREVIDLSLAIEKPILPLSFTGGVSLEKWDENKELIKDWFGITRDAAKELEKLKLAHLSGTKLNKVAKLIKAHLLRKLRKCFVMMPFSRQFKWLYETVIKPAIIAQGFIPVRVDEQKLTGNAIKIVRTEIESCDCAIAVITGHNANVMYELGLAHAQDKPVIVLCEFSRGNRFGKMPFDLLNESIIGYGKNSGILQKDIETSLNRIRQHSAFEASAI